VLYFIFYRRVNERKNNREALLIVFNRERKRVIFMKILMYNREKKEFMRDFIPKR
jgi:hypothetical protein